MLMSKWPFETSNKKVPNKRKTLLVVIIIAAIVLIAAGAAAWYFFKPSSKEDVSSSNQANSIDYKQAKETITATQLSEAELTKLVDEYGPQYDAALKEVQESHPTIWKQPLIDKAHFCLLYADKVGSKAQVQSVYYQIFAAQQTGINVDNNATGLTQQDREAIFQRNQLPEDSGTLEGDS